uniref:Uncharacterized protein n=1 Tax=Molossus molossus TaxID=27622 RepID=A0A7J8JVG0_MOLMO|nr:hypothetical protein HJG59_007804 [Molossus molossus]
MEGAEAERAGVCARGCVRVCVCECVCARAWLGVRLFGELTGEPGPSRGRADSAGCRGQPVLQPRPLNQPAPPDLCKPPPQPQAALPAGLCAPRDGRDRGCGRRQGPRTDGDNQPLGKQREPLAH